MALHPIAILQTQLYIMTLAQSEQRADSRNNDLMFEKAKEAWTEWLHSTEMTSKDYDERNDEHDYLEDIRAAAIEGGMGEIEKEFKKAKARFKEKTKNNILNFLKGKRERTRTVRPPRTIDIS